VSLSGLLAAHVNNACSKGISRSSSSPPCENVFITKTPWLHVIRSLLACKMQDEVIASTPSHHTMITRTRLFRRACCPPGNIVSVHFNESWRGRLLVAYLELLHVEGAVLVFVHHAEDLLDTLFGSVFVFGEFDHGADLFDNMSKMDCDD
jgi:hypothetical protein